MSGPYYMTREQFEAEHQGLVPWLEPRDVDLPIAVEIFGYVQSSVSWQNDDRFVRDGMGRRRALAAAPPTLEANVVFLGRLDENLVTIAATWRGCAASPPQGYWSDYRIERKLTDPSEDDALEAMRRGRQIMRPRKTREREIVAADVRADEAAFESVVEEIEKQ